MAKVAAALVVPSRDYTLSTLQRVGAEQLDRGIFDKFELANPVLMYLSARRRAWIEESVSVLPWALLGAAEVAALAYSWYILSIGPFRLLLTLEVLFLPLLLGIWAGWRVAAHFAANRRRSPIEDLVGTRLAPEDILFGLTARPILTQLGAHHIAVFTLALSVLGWVAAMKGMRGSIGNMLGMLVIGFGIVYRSRLLPSCIQMASVLSLRSIAMAKPGTWPFAAFLRAYLPWGAATIAAPLVLMLASRLLVGGLGALAGGFGVLLATLAALYFLAAYPAFLAESASNYLYETLRARRDWFGDARARE